MFAVFCHLRLVKGTSGKFLKIYADGKSLKTTYGKIGTEGRNTAKKFESEEKCQEEAEKLYRKMKEKGYKTGGIPSDKEILANLDKSIDSFECSGQFGYISKFKCLNDVLKIIPDVSSHKAKLCSAAYGMLLAANLADKRDPYINGSKEVLNNLSFAKAKIDIVSHQQPYITNVTSDIFLTAQNYMEEIVRPCTEWPTAVEMIEIVKTAAIKYTGNFEWRLNKYREDGARIGDYVVDE
jgi:predicted DNA-binding WGR domain protein